MPQDITLRIKVDGSGNIVIDQTSEKIRKLGDEGENAGKRISASFEVMKGILEAEIVQRGAEAVVDFFKEAVKAAGEAEAAYAQLQSALHGDAGATDELREMNEKLRDSFGESIPELTQAESKLATYGMSAKDIAATIPVAMDLATRFHISLEQAATLLGKTFDGNAMMLRRLIPDFESAGAGAAALADNLGQVEAHVGGAKAAEMGTYEGQLKLLEGQFEKMKEALGEQLLPVLIQIMPEFKEFVGGLATDEEALKAFAKMALYSATAVDAVTYSLAGATKYGSEVLGSVVGIFSDKEGEEIFNFGSSIDKVQETLGRLGGTLLNAIDNVDNYSKKHEAAKKAVENHAAAVKGLTEEQQQSIDKVDAFLAKLDDAAHPSGEADRKLVELGREAQNTADAMKAAGLSTEKFWATVNEELQLIASNNAAEAAKKQAEEIEKIFDELDKKLSDESKKYMFDFGGGILGIQGERAKALSELDATFGQILQISGLDHAKLLQEEEKYRQARQQINELYDAKLKEEQKKTDNELLAEIYRETGIMLEAYKQQQEALIKEKADAEIAYLRSQENRDDLTVEEQRKIADAIEAIQNKESADLRNLANEGIQPVTDHLNSAHDSASRLGDGLVSAAGAGKSAFQSLDQEIEASFNFLNSTLTAAQEIAAVFGAEAPHIIGYDGSTVIWNTPTGAAPTGPTAGASIIGYDGDQAVYDNGTTGPIPQAASGMDIVPSDMVVKVHKSEAILNPEDAAAWRSGKGGGGLSVGELHVHAAPGELATQTDQTRFVREVVIPELARAVR